MSKKKNSVKKNNFEVVQGNAFNILSGLSEEPLFDLVVTSPPYNIGKEYEDKKSLSEYLEEQKLIIEQIVPRIKGSGSLCWQVGNHVSKDTLIPLDIVFHPIFEELGMKLKNRIIWKFGHGAHAKKKFSGRYEVILWYVKSNKYKFNLDDVRIDQKYPSKVSYKGPNKGEFSGNPKGKNPEDFWEWDLDNNQNNDSVWDIPNVKNNHIEKLNHPCQFPVVLVERLVKALTDKDDLVLDPFMGTGSAGVAALHNKRRFLGIELEQKYINLALPRLTKSRSKKELFRQDKPVYDHKKSNLSKKPKQFKKIK